MNKCFIGMFIVVNSIWHEKVYQNLFDCYKLGGFPKTTENRSLLIFMDQSKKIAVPRLCNEITLTASVFAPQPELPSLYVEVLEVAPIFDYI